MNPRRLLPAILLPAILLLAILGIGIANAAADTASGATAVVTGAYHTCVLTSAGGVLCWGLNDVGELGDGTNLNRSTPVPVSGLSTGVTAIAAGGFHTCALTSAGGVLCWGYNDDGELGNGTTAGSLTPVPVSGLSSGVVAISAGYYHTCAVLTGGGLRCWGYAAQYQLGNGSNVNQSTPVQVSGLTSGVAAVSAGGFHTCALMSDAIVKCWGDSTYGQAGQNYGVPVQLPTTFATFSSDTAGLAAGFLHSCVWASSRAVQCWGQGQYGQTGYDPNGTHSTPTSTVELPGGARHAAAGGAHTCAVSSEGQAWCWGDDEYGQLGDDGTANLQWKPVRVSNISGGLTSVAAGYAHTCALTSAGGVRCWGDNSAGQLGDGTTTMRKVPAVVTGLAGVGPLVLSAEVGEASATTATFRGLVNPDGGQTTAWFEYGLTTSYGSVTSSGDMGGGTAEVTVTAQVAGLTCGTAYHFRLIASNDLGTASSTDRLLVTVPCVAVNRVGIAAGGSHACAVSAAGALWCWGLNDVGQLGDATTQTRRYLVAVSGIASGVVAVVAGRSHTCALTSTGGVLCWGNNADGQLGDGTTTMRSTPVPVSGLSSGVLAVAAGSWHTCALTASGGVLCWGRNLSGQLGDGTTTNRPIPVVVSGIALGAVAVAAGNTHTCALSSAGRVLCWGANTTGALGDGTTTSRNTPAPASALPTGAAAVSAGEGYACAVTFGGALMCWGRNDYGQLGDGTTTNQLTPATVSGLSTGPVAVAASDRFTCAVTASAGALCWGYNYDGQLGDGTTTFRATPSGVIGLSGGVAAIAAGRGYACALTSAGNVSCWGDNFYGELGDGTMTRRYTPTPIIGFGSTAPIPRPGLASSIEQYSAVIDGTVVPSGLPTTAWFEYSASVGPLWTTPAQSVGDGTAPVSISAPVSGLACGTVYTFHVAATNSYATIRSDNGGFRTAACPVPTVTSIVPTIGALIGNTLITVRGTNFQPGTSVKVGSNWATLATVVSSTEITATAPWGFSGLVDVVVQLPDGQAATLSKAYRYQRLAASDFGGAGKSDLVVFRGATGDWWIQGQAGATRFGQAGDIPVAADYNGDGRAEFAIYRPSTGEWIVKDQQAIAFGQPGDVPVPGDYDGDGLAEMAVFRPATGEWIIAGQETPTVWGMRGDIPVPADYGGDGITELAVYRPTTGTWYIRGGTPIQWGMWGDVPVPADYTYSGKAKIAVYRPSTGFWYVMGLTPVQWGAPGDVPVPLNLDGDSTAEFVVFRPGTGFWYSYNPLTKATSSAAWGQEGDVPIGPLPQVPPAPTLKTDGDFDHDGTTDVTVFRPSDGGWYTLQSTHAYRTSVGVILGQPGDIPVPGDYQGTGDQERAVFRPSTGEWLLEDGRTFALGAPDDVPAPGDYDGDAVTDIAVFTPGTGLWSILTGASGFTTLVTESWGAAGDVPAPGDFDGDGKTDVAVFTPATGLWSIRSSLTGATLVAVPFGMSGDIPVPGDYDGDGATDIAVYRPTTGYWYVLTSSSGWSNYLWHWWGAVGDIPVPGDYDGDDVTDVAVYRPSTGAWYVMNVMTITGWGVATDVPVFARK